MLVSKRGGLDSRLPGADNRKFAGRIIEGDVVEGVTGGPVRKAGELRWSGRERANAGRDDHVAGAQRLTRVQHQREAARVGLHPDHQTAAHPRYDPLLEPAAVTGERVKPDRYPDVPVLDVELSAVPRQRVLLAGGLRDSRRTPRT